MSIKLNNRVVDIEQRANEMENRICALEALMTAPELPKEVKPPEVVAPANLSKTRGRPKK